MYTVNKNYAGFLPPCCMDIRVPISSLWRGGLQTMYIPCNHLPVKNCLKSAVNWCSASKRRFMSPQCQGYVNKRNFKYFAPLYTNYCNYGDLTGVNNPCRKAVMKFNNVAFDFLNKITNTPYLDRNNHGNNLQITPDLTKVFDSSIDTYCKKRTNNVSIGTPYHNDYICSCYAARKKYGDNLACNDECRRYGYKNAKTLRLFKNKPCTNNDCYRFPNYTRNLVFPRRNSPLIMSTPLSKKCRPNSKFINITPRRDISYKTNILPVPR